MKPIVNLAKLLIIISFVVLLASTYTLRSRLLTLINHQLAASETTEQARLDRFNEAKEDRGLAYEASLANYRKNMESYLAALRKAAGVQSDEQKAAGGTEPAAPLTQEQQYRQQMMQQQAYERQATIPPRPELGTAPATRERLASISESFRKDQQAYFGLATRMNWVVGTCAMVLVGSLLVLILFDPAGSRVAYIIILVLSFVFLIGPAFYTSLTAIAWRMDPPKYDTPDIQRGY